MASEMDKNREIELRVKIENNQSLISFLNKNAKFEGEGYQTDLYYLSPGQNFLTENPITQWLRLRESGGKYWINYKKWHYEEDGSSHYCQEYETVIENYPQMQQILKALGFEILTVVNKLRKTWRYGDWEVAIDEVESLGNFVEIEYKGDPSSVVPQQITTEMMEFLEGCNVGKIERNHVGYPYMILFGDKPKQ